MREFKDSEGRPWRLVVNVNTIEEIKRRLDVDITDLYLDTGSKVFSNPALLVNVLYVLCENQAKSKEVTDIHFGEAMIGDALEDGANALMLAVSDFFPSRKRPLMAAQLAKAKEIGNAAETKAMQIIESLTPEQFFKSAESSAASSEPTRAH